MIPLLWRALELFTLFLALLPAALGYVLVLVADLLFRLAVLIATLPVRKPR